ncbi:MAG: hypothetical protein NC253_09135 [Ruminococcus sp.]|nr:hypothetical protein [Ruminococcus sp.]MCM1380521.1 hypothetical protein [Muribaculaceae bacterium]MCM1478665.1 hypothetical protein [Muribaculaceae bacterium]
MKKILCGIAALAMCAALAGCAKNGGEVQTVTCLASEPVQTVSETVRAEYGVEEVSGYFEYGLLKEIAGERKNAVASPLSVKLAMNMAALGAEGDTEKELLTLFGYESGEQMRERSKSAVTELNRADGSITVNNSVWIESGIDYIAESYVDGLTDVFGAETFREKLREQEIVGKLNGWIDGKTNGLIPDMINAPFDEDARMFLVNAVYFKNEWVYEFKSFEGGTMTFCGAEGDSKTAVMYLERAGIKYGENEFFRSVSLDYEDGSCMNIYLPVDETGSVLDVIEKSDPEELAAAMDIEYGEEKVSISIPKFECDYSKSVKEILQKMGVSRAFDGHGFAEFDGMVDEGAEEKLYISDVIHAAKILCNEKGTEAAAATVAAAETTAAPEEPPIYFIADRPFIYELKAANGETLFIGVICGF